MDLQCNFDEITVALIVFSSANELNRCPEGPNQVISALGCASTIHSVLISSFSITANFLIEFKINGASKTKVHR